MLTVSRQSASQAPRIFGGFQSKLRNSSAGSRNFGTEASQIDGVAQIVIPRHQLRPSYQKIFGRITDMTARIAIAAYGSPISAAGWCMLTNQYLYESPVAVTMLLVGAWVISDASLQIFRTRKFVELGVCCDQQGPSVDASINKAVFEVLQGGAPFVRVYSHELIISGSSGAMVDAIPSKKTLQRVKNLKKINLPEIVLSYPVSGHVALIFDRWMTRIATPSSILNILSIMAKAGDKNEKLSADDLVILAASIKNLHDFFENSSLSEEVEKFENYLKSGKTPEQLVKLLVDEEFFNGPLSFMHYWAEGVNPVSVRVDRLGNLCIYRKRSRSFLGPMSIRQFPEHKT